MEDLYYYLKKISQGDISYIDLVKSVEQINLSEKELFLIDLLSLGSVYNRYMLGEISKEDLLKWVNFIWFSDYFIYEEVNKDKISDAIYLLEQLDEFEDESALLDKINRILTL